MSKLRISDAPLLPDVSGLEKIPTGGRGDYAISVDQIKGHIFQDVGKELVGLGNVDNTSDLDKPISTAQQAALNLKADKTYVDTNLDLKADKTNVYTRSETTLALSQKADLVSGVIPSNQLPSYVDDVVEYTTSTLPIVGEIGKIYITTDTNRTWRWSGNQYVEISNGGVSDSTIKLQTVRKIANVDFDGTQDISIPHNNLINRDEVGAHLATSILSASGEDQQDINDYTGAKWRNKAGGYDLNARVMLNNGDIVKSTVNGNANDPNVSMTGWTKVNSADNLEYSFDVLRSIHSRLGDEVSVKDFGAIGDGVQHTVSEWTQIGSRIYYPDLTAIQVDFPHVTSLSDSIDWAAAQKAVNTENVYKIKFPCTTSIGRYEFGSNELIIPNSRSNITFVGDGSSDAGATVINSAPNKVGFIAINAKSYGFTLQDIALLSTTGNNDGFNAIGVKHMREMIASVGRVVWRNVRIMGFSKHAVKIGIAISYMFENVTFSGGVETLWIGQDDGKLQRSTTVTVKHGYITSGKRCGVYLDYPSDFVGERLIIESCGKTYQPDGITPIYADASGLIADRVGQCTLVGAYFEDNHRNIWANTSVVDIGSNFGPAKVSDVYEPLAGSTYGDRGNVRIQRNYIRVRKILADPYTNILELPDQALFSSTVTFSPTAKVVVQKEMFIGSDVDKLRVNGPVSLTLNSNMIGAENLNVIGQELKFGATDTGTGATTSRWNILGHRRVDTSNTALAVYSALGTTSFAPSSAYSKIVEFNSKLGLVIVPKSNSTPEINGEMVFELSSNTQLTVKVKGSDGIVRSASLTLA